MIRTSLFSMLCGILTLGILGIASAADEGYPKRDLDGISEISLERTACFGSCPVYKFTFRADGTVSYVGKDHARLEGKFKGTFSKADFQELARLALLIGYFSLENEYSGPVTDSPTAITTVVRKGVAKTISNYANLGPLRLAGFEYAIEVVGGRTDMQKEK